MIVQVAEGRYQLQPHRRLGDGQYYDVYAGLERATGRRVAVKVTREPDGAPGDPSPAACADHARGEAFALRRVGSHPGVVRLREVLHDQTVALGRRAPHRLCTVVVTSLVPHGELFHLIKAGGAVPERVARPLARRLAEALAHAHAQGVAHRDLKPEQVMLDERMRPVLGDWGFAVAGCGRPGQATRRYDPVGTRSYMAPEVATPDVFGDGYDPYAADAWSLGVVLYVLLCGFPPFTHASRRCPHYRRWADESPRFWGVAEAQGVGPPPAARRLLRRLMCPDPARRATVAEALAHPWLAAAHDEGAAEEEYRACLARRREKVLGLGLGVRLPAPAREACAGAAGATTPAAAARAEDKENKAPPPPAVRQPRRLSSSAPGADPAPASPPPPPPPPGDGARRQLDMLDAAGAAAGWCG